MMISLDMRVCYNVYYDDDVEEFRCWPIERKTKYSLFTSREHFIYRYTFFFFYPFEPCAIKCSVIFIYYLSFFLIVSLFAN